MSSLTGFPLRVPTSVTTLSGPVDVGGEEPDLDDRPLDAARLHIVTHLEGTEHDEKCSGREIREQPTPGGADRYTDARHQSRERRRLDAEVAEERDDEHDVQRDGEDVGEVPYQGRIDVLARESPPEQPHDQADQPPPDDPDRDGSQRSQAEGDQDGARGGGEGAGGRRHVLCVHRGPPVP